MSFGDIFKDITGGLTDVFGLASAGVEAASGIYQTVQNFGQAPPAPAPAAPPLSTQIAIPIPGLSYGIPTLPQYHSDPVHTTSQSNATNAILEQEGRGFRVDPTLMVIGLAALGVAVWLSR